MNEEDFTIARELKDQLSAIVKLLDFSVFGSRARGDARESSDMDVFVEVLTLDKLMKERTYDIAWKIGFDNSRVISLLIFTRDELENSPLRASPIVRSMEREGLRI